MAHTPGPWAFEKERDTAKSWSATVYSTATDTGVARVGYFDTDNAEDEANARLMAAAPELLDALTRAVEAHGPLGDGTCPEWWATACAVIAAAEGR